VEAKRHGIGYTRLRGELVAVVDNRSGEPRRKLILLGTERGQDGPGLASFSRNATVSPKMQPNDVTSVPGSFPWHVLRFFCRRGLRQQRFDHQRPCR
jgi:hypothetical protein